MNITLDTPLADICWDNANEMDNSLIDTMLAGDEWELAWDRVARQNGTVRDLRDALYADHADRLDVADLMNSAIDRDDRVKLNQALRASLAGRESYAIATTEVNGGDIAILTLDGEPMNVGQALAEIDRFLVADEG